MIREDYPKALINQRSPKRPVIDFLTLRVSARRREWLRTERFNTDWTLL